MGKIEALRLLDTALEAHLRQLADLPEEARPVILLAGDHGPPTTCDQISPQATLLVPHHLPETDVLWRSWRRNLEQNRFTITSWFDMYATFRHMAEARDPGKLAQVSGKQEEVDVFGHRTRSLLRPMPSNRTCSQAGIPEWHCGCSQNWQPWCPIANSALNVVAQKGLDELMAQTHKYLRQQKLDLDICPYLTLKAVTRCEGQGETLSRLQDDLVEAGGRQDAILRVNILTEQGMAYEFYAKVEFTSMAGNYQGMVANTQEIFNMWPRTKYAHHESCTPRGADPAFCACHKGPVKADPDDMGQHSQSVTYINQGGGVKFT